MSKLGSALSVLLLIAHAGGSAEAQTSAKDRAKRHFAKGFSYYQNGEYLKAVKELKTAYEIRPVPVVLFYIGKTFQSAGLEVEAARALWQFLDESTLNDPKRAQAIAALKEMKKPLRRPAAGITEPDVTPPDRRATEPPPPVIRKRRRRAVGPGGIIHEPVEEARPGHPIVMEAELPEDFGDYARLYLYYRPKGFEKFFKKPMKPDERSIYQGCIPPRHLDGTSIQYYIEAVGRTGKRKAGSGTSSSPNIIALMEDAPLQAGGRLKACPGEGPQAGGTGVGPGPGTPGEGPMGPGVTPGTDEGKPSRLKLYGFIAAAAATVAALSTGVALSVTARDKAQEMANAGVGGPVIPFDGEVENIEKQGKAMDAGAIACYVLAGLAAAGATYLALDLWVFNVLNRSSKEEPPKEPGPAPSPDEPGRVLIVPTLGPGVVGLSGEIRF